MAKKQCVKISSIVCNHVIVFFDVFLCNCRTNTEVHYLSPINVHVDSSRIVFFVCVDQKVLLL